MSAYNRSKFKQNYEIIGNQFPNKKNIDLVLTELETNIVKKMIKFIDEYKNEYKLRKINKNTLIIHAANLSNFEKKLEKLDNEELNINNRDLFELNINDPNKRREGSTSFTFNNNNYYLSKNKKPMEMSLISVYTGVRDEYLGRILMFRNKEDLYVLDIVDYSIDLNQVQQNHSVSYNRRILFNILVFNYFLGDITGIYLNYDPGLQYLQRIIYYIFELYNKKKSDTDPNINGMLMLDASVDPLLWKNDNELYFIPGVELLLFKPESDIVLESLYYIKDNIMIYDIETWRKYLEKILKEFREHHEDKLRAFNIHEFTRLSKIIDSYANKCRNIYMLNEMYNPIEKLKNKIFKMDTECSCMIVKNISDYNKAKNIQTNKQPLLSDMVSEEKNKEFDVQKQNKAFVVQEVCLKDMSEEYMVPTKPNNVIRLMSYNVHYWQGPRDKKKYVINGSQKDHKYNGNEIIDVIASLNPDIVALQEVMNINILNDGWSYINWDEIRNKLLSYGYILTSENGKLNFCGADSDYFGNMLIHKNTITLNNFKSIVFNEPGAKSINKFGKRRCMIKAEALINGQKYSICCIHLDDTSSEGRNKFIDLVVDDLRTDPNIKILMGDFNSYRMNYPYQKLKSANMIDCYAHKQLNPPKYTTWTGTEIDFIMIDKNINPENILGCFVAHTPVSDHLPILMDLKIKPNVSYDGTFIRLPYDHYENSIDTDYLHELNTISSAKNWFPYITKNLLNDKNISKEYVELPTEDIISKFTLVDRIPFNKLVNDKDLLGKKNIVKHLSKTKLNLVSYLQKRPLFSNGTGVNLVDNQIYELIDGYLDPLPSTWYYDDYDIRANIQKGGGYIYPSVSYKVSLDLLGDINSKMANNNNNSLLNLIYEKNCDFFIKFEELNEDSKWISLHALCYYLYAKKNKLPLIINKNFDKQFIVKMGLFPLTNQVDIGTIPVNTIENRRVWIHPVNNEVAFSPPDQQSFIFKNLQQSDIYVTVVESIIADGQEFLNKPIVTIHVINYYGNNVTFEDLFITYLKNYVNTNEPQSGGYNKYLKYRKNIYF